MLKRKINMNFSKALYYPSIDIKNEEWLKSAILFWDEIDTIVPISVNNPYKNYSTQYLEDEGIIKPILINSQSRYAEAIMSDVLKFINSNAGIQMLNDSTDGAMRLNFSVQKALLHQDKVDAHLIDELQRVMRFQSDGRGYYHLNPEFVSFYMTLLANRISEDKSLALVTDNSLNIQLTETIRYDNDVSNTFFTTYNTEWRIPHVTLKQGLLTNFVIDNMRISETTSLADIIAFRQHHKDELAKFRINLSKLVDSIDAANSLEALHQNIQTIYADEFTPAYNDFKKALKSSKIKWVFDNLSKLCVFSVSTTAVPVMLGASMPQAVFLGAGVSAVSSAIAYNVDNAEKLRKNPYSYLLKIDRDL